MKFLVFAEKENGDVHRFECFAESKKEAENKILAVWQGYGFVKATAFDYSIQFRCMRSSNI